MNEHLFRIETNLTNPVNFAQISDDKVLHVQWLNGRIYVDHLLNVFRLLSFIQLPRQSTNYESWQITSRCDINWLSAGWLRPSWAAGSFAICWSAISIAIAILVFTPITTAGTTTSDTFRIDGLGTVLIRNYVDRVLFSFIKFISLKVLTIYVRFFLLPYSWAILFSHLNILYNSVQ